jgi:transposase
MKGPEHMEVNPEQLRDLLKRVKGAPGVSTEDYVLIETMVETVLFLSQAVVNKSASIRRLLRMIFGASTEKKKNIIKPSDNPPSHNSEPDTPTANPDNTNGETPSGKAKGHGRNGVLAYRGAQKIFVPHQTLKPKDPCPECPKGRVYELKDPAVLLRILGKPPLDATVYELQRLRCNLCGTVFTAEPPKEAGQNVYDESAGTMVALLKYGNGVPFYRLEQLQKSLGIPIPSSTQWDLAEKAADRIHPAYRELLRQGAQGNIVHNDDTTMKVLALMGNDPEDQDTRKGVFTSGIVSLSEGHKIALFFTGRNHAGENLQNVLEKRSPDLDLPIQMCDALSRNVPKDFRTILANCLAHGRRQFVDVIPSFPDQAGHVIDVLAQVYKNDQTAKEQHLSPQDRLLFHQRYSGPLMEELKQWFTAQFEEKQVEPNSGMGKAIRYMLNHWEPLTLFLRKEGAPLDNNVCEQALKKAILHRKNALFYKTEHGAYIGDMFMSLIHTCTLMNINPFDYLIALQRHSSEVFKHPKNWMPWNYHFQLAPESDQATAQARPM